MTRFNPLLQSLSKKNIEIVRPQIFQNTINQTNDNVVIEKLVNQKLLVGQDDKIISSSYTINDVVLECKKSIPTPLQAGTNVSIVDGIVSAGMYDDTGVRSAIKNTQENMVDKFTNLSQNNTDLENRINEKCENLSKQQSSITHEVNQLKEHQDVLTKLSNDNTQHLDNEIAVYRKEIDIVKEATIKLGDVIQVKMEELETKYDGKLNEISINISNDKVLDKKYKEDSFEQLKEIKQNTENKLTYNVLEISEKLNDVIHQNEDTFNHFKNNIEIKMNNMVDSLDKKYKKEIQERDSKISHLKTTIDKLHAEVVVLRELDPNSKQLQKIIKQLTDKVSLIDKHFKFTT